MERFEEFLTERKYFKNVTDKTLVYYRCAFRSWEYHANRDWKAWIVKLRQSGISAVSINTYICAMNAYWRWAGTGIKVEYLKEEEKILATLTPDQIKRIVSFKPKGRNQTRVHTAALLMLDGGYRISEVLGLLFEHCDFDNLVVKVKGKGNKHRLVPLSMEMRRVLYRYAAKHSGPGRLLFGTRNSTQVTVRNFERDFALMGEKLAITGVRFSPTRYATHLQSAISAPGAISSTCPKSLATPASPPRRSTSRAWELMICKRCMTVCHRWEGAKHYELPSHTKMILAPL